ncbi:hypothetical protein M422DRAFT_177999, partial [Sphaerobolus stellatus SS14]
TQQTNIVDVDKYMMEYIEENLRKRRGAATEEKKDEGPRDPFEELYRFNKYITQVKPKETEEGNVTNSLAMLTAIPEVDLGMDSRLKNIEETEKAKRQVADERRSGKGREGAVPKDEEHLVATRFYRPHSTEQSDAEALRRAKLEAMGINPGEEVRRPHHDKRPQTSTDEQVMERFKKRMRK